MLANFVNRRRCIALGAGLAASGLLPTAWTQTVRVACTVLVLGDSLSAEYGLKRGTGWVALLQKKLSPDLSDLSHLSHLSNIPSPPVVTVVNASISGDTTSGGRSRLPALLARYQPDIVVIELGGNDALRGLPLAMTQDNLSAMTQSAQNIHAKVLLIGMQIPPNYGRVYAAQFATMFAQVAKAHKVGLVPFLLRTLADAPDRTQWFQPDGIHPVEAAQTVMLANVWPNLKPLLP